MAGQDFESQHSLYADLLMFMVDRNMFVSVNVITSLVSLEFESCVSKVIIYLSYTMFVSAVLRAITTGDTIKKVHTLNKFKCKF
jgi:hypothetical protein